MPPSEPPPDEAPEPLLLSVASPYLRRCSPDRGKYFCGLLFVGVAPLAWSLITFLWSAAMFLRTRPGLDSMLECVVLLLAAAVVALVALAACFVGAVLLLEEMALEFPDVEVSLWPASLSWKHDERLPDTRPLPTEPRSALTGSLLGGHIEQRPPRKGAAPPPGPDGQPRSRVPVLVLTQEDEYTLEIELNDDESASALLWGLKLDASHHRATFALRTPVRGALTRAVGSAAALLQLFSACVLAGLGWARAAAAWLAEASGVDALENGWALALASIAVWLVAWKLAPWAHDPAVRVGADGIGGEGVPGGFLRWSEVDAVSSAAHQVTVSGRGASATLSLRGQPAAEAMALRSGEAQALWPSGDVVMPPELSGPRRPPAAWRQALQALATDQGPYRGNGSRDVLAFFLLNPATPRAERVAAAVALASQGDEGREEVRAALRSFADPELLRLLALVADGLDDEALAAVAA